MRNLKLGLALSLAAMSSATIPLNRYENKIEDNIWDPHNFGVRLGKHFGKKRKVDRPVIDGSKPTKRRMKVKLARKANLKRLKNR